MAFAIAQLQLRSSQPVTGWANPDDLFSRAERARAKFPAEVPTDEDVKAGGE